MLELINRYAHGFVAVPVILACRERGLFELLTQPMTSLELARHLGANEGHLQVALRLLHSLNWLERNEEGEYCLTKRAKSHSALPSEILTLYQGDMSAYLMGEGGPLREWIERSQKRWEFSDPQMADFLDGVVVIPLLLALHQNDGLLESEKIRLSPLAPLVRKELSDLFIGKGWALREGMTLLLTDVGQFWNEADRLLIVLATWGYFPTSNWFKHFIDRFYSHEPSHKWFEQRPYIIRHPRLSDLPALVCLEDECWAELLRASSFEIEERISRFPDGHCVVEIDSRVVGVIYSQRLESTNPLNEMTFSEVSSLHTEQGPIMQLLAANVLPEMQHYGLGDQLLEFMLQYCTLKSGISRVVAVTLCKNYVDHSHLPMEEYIQKRTEQGRIFDPILHFHESHGATIKRVINGYRPEDVDNQGKGILVEYDLLHRQEQIGNKFDSLPRDKRDTQSSSSLVEEAVRSVMGPKHQAAFSPERPLMEMGLDSLDLLELKSLLSQRFGQELNPTFFFQYGTAKAIAGYFEGQVQPEAIPSSQARRHRAADEEVTASRLPNLQPSTQELSSFEEKESRYKNEQIAIISMACRFPGGVTTPEAYWTLLQEGVDAITEVPQTRWHPADYGGQIKSCYGGFIEQVAQFDAPFFRMAPVEAVATDPQQRLLLEVTWEALERACIEPSALAGSETGVFVGIFTNDYQLLQVKQRENPTAYFGTGTSSSLAAGRLSYFFGFQGPAMAVDTACSSSLVAVHLACQSLRSGECDLALASGVNLILSPELSITFSKAEMLAPDGRCKTFDAQANGYVRSEGCGIVLLKRLKEARQDNDNILAVVRGSAVNQDGTSNGLTAPNGLAQEAVIRKALTAANVEPREVSYVEAHGTGTSLGDPVEVKSLEAVYGEGRTENSPLIIGSVKTNIGHTEAAAGMAGLLKVVLSMQHGYLPPHLHFKKANPYLSLEKIPAVIPTKGMVWEKVTRLAGVSSFGFSGTNAHLLLEEAHANKQAKEKCNSDNQRHHLLTLSAKNEQALEALAHRYIDFFDTNSSHTLADICSTTNVGRTHFEHRLAIVAETTITLGEQLQAFFANRLETSGLFSGQINSEKQPKTAFLCTGQGSQYVDMGRELYDTQPTFRRVLNHCDDILRPYLEQPLLSILYPRSNNTQSSVNDEQATINQTAYTQPALFAIEYALIELWKSWGITADVIMGHSVGEYVAACVAGVFSLEDGLKLIAARGRLIQQLPQNGEMAAIRASESQVQDILSTYEDKVSIAAINAPESLVISGEQQAVQTLLLAFEAKGIKTQRLTVSHAFHSPLMEPMLSEFIQVANEIHFFPPQLDLISNVTGKLATNDIATPAYWVHHVRQPVRFVNGMETLHNLGANIFIEIGPKPILLELGRRCLFDNQEASNILYQWLPSLRFGWSDWQQMLASLGNLYVRGLKIDWAGFNRDYQQQQQRRVILPTYPFQREHYWIETTTDNNSLCVLPTPHEIVRNLSSTSLIEQSTFYEEILAHIESLSVKYILSALKKMGWHWQVGQRFSLQQFVVDMKIQGHQQLLDRLLDILVEEEILQQKGKEWEVLFVPDSNLPQPLLDKYPRAEAELTLLARCGSRLADVLQGVCNPIQVLFPEADVTTLATLYQDSPAFGAMNKLVQQVISEVMARLQAGQMVHILEIGAGTGGTTAHVLPHLSASQTKYVFSDIGPLFLAKAQKKFKDYPFISYRQLNIEQEPQPQGFGEAQFDLILAANVLHATKNLQQTLEHVHSMLAPNGLLVLQEGVARRHWIDITFGLTEGWWRFTDDSLRPDYPLLSPPQWSQLLQDTGFKEASSISLNEMDQQLFPQAVIIAQVPENASRSQERYSLEMPRYEEHNKIEQPLDILQELQSIPANQHQALLTSYVCQQMALILGVASAKAISTQTQFIEMGMDSLMSMELVNRLQSSLNCRLPSALVFEYSTVAKLAEYLATEIIGREELEKSASPTNIRTKTTDAAVPIAEAEKAKVISPVHRNAPTSILQERQWILIQRDEDSNYSHIFQAWNLVGGLDIVTLKQAVTEIVRRHEALRTTFKVINGTLTQVITSPSSIPLPLIDLRELSATERSDKVPQLIHQESSRSFDLANDCLLRACLLQLGDEHQVLLLTTTCIVCDHASTGILNQELSQLYAAFLHHTSPALPSLPMQYADYAIWEREYLTGTVLAEHLSYWEHKLSGLLPLELSTDRPRPHVRTFYSSEEHFQLNAVLIQKLKMLGQQSGGTLYMVFLSAYATLLSRYSGQNDFAVGTPFTCRSQTEVDSLIGWFIVHLPLRINLEENPSFQDLLKQVKQTTLEGLAHRYIPLEQLRTLLEQGNRKNQQQWFQVGFNYRNQTIMWHDLELAGLKVTSLDGEHQRGQAAYDDLDLVLHETEQGIDGKFLYNTDLFDATTIARMVRHFQVLLEGIIASPDRRIAKLPLLSKTEQSRLLYEWNDSQIPYSFDKCIYQIFEEQVEKTPDALALLGKEGQLTYQALNNRANQLAHHLQALGVGPEVIVGICVERSIEMIVGLLGIFKAGGAYLPLDPVYPKEHLAYILSDAQVKGLVTQEAQVRGDLQAFINNEQLWTVCLDTEWEIIAKCSRENPISVVTPENLAYVMYTSGSTGRPKGVMIEHRSLTNFIEAAKGQFEISLCDRVLQFSSISFDAAVEEIYSCLTAGATLVLRDDQMLSGVAKFIQQCQDLQLTVLDLPTAYWHVLISELVTAKLTFPKPVRLVIIGGEQALAEKVRLWQEYIGHYPQLLNVYGPTEGTAVATMYKFSSVNAIRYNESPDTPLPTVPIGRPIGNVLVYLLDKLLQPVPIGVAGELHIGGVGVARGYLNRPDLTREKFIRNPFSEEPMARLYKTGDLARYLPDGNIEFICRADNQVKIRGFRVEIGEIEAWLSKAPAVLKGVVIVREEQLLGNKRLVAYVVPNQPAFSISLVKDFLKEKLPDYMVPSAFVVLDSLPLTSNGKIDRSALPEPSSSVLNREDEIVSPRNNTELQLVQIWENVLNTHPVGVQSNFFDLGGHSLLAVSLVAQIQEQFGRELPLGSLFQNPTIEHQANLLTEKTDDAKKTFSPLIPIQATGKQSPFFCVHPIGGSALCYVDLARQLGSSQPFYGLQSPGLSGEQAPLASIEEMAAVYNDALKTIQPEGPYYLGGWSLGGLVAFEMARLLHASGNEIALLALIDSYTAAALKASEEVDNVFLASFFAKNLFAASEEDFSISDEELQELSTDEQLDYILEQAKKFHLLTKATNPQQIHQLFKIFKSNRQAMVRYIPQSYRGKITFFFANDTFAPVKENPTQSWCELATDGIDVHEIQGDHYTIVRSSTLADKLRTKIVTSC